MDSEPDYDESSSNDVDYIPSGDESDDVISGDEEYRAPGSKKRSRTRKTKTKKRRVSPRKRRGGIKLKEKHSETSESENDDNSEDNDYNDDDDDNDDDDQNDASNDNDQSKKPESVNEKQKADSLWADFLKDVDPPAKSKPRYDKKQTKTNSESEPESTTDSVSSKKTTITQVFDFAGETVSITKEVDSDSKEVKQYTDKDSSNEDQQPSSENPKGGIKRTGSIGNVLGKIMNKKPKMTTLDKSKLDWENFKKDENIDDELRSHNKGKSGYLERQAFLERVDVRQFEAEKSLREINRSKR